MTTAVYATLAKVFGSAMVGVGAGALVGGAFAHSFIGKQLGSEAITMPTAAEIGREEEAGVIRPGDARILRRYAGQVLSTGTHAQVYSENYILAHMLAAAVRAGVPEEKATYAGVGDVINDKTRELRALLREEPGNENKSPAEINMMAKMEIGDPESDFPIAREIADLYVLRSDNFFMGNALRGMLLNTYAWSIVGTVATAVGAGLMAAGAGLGIGGIIAGKQSPS